MELFVKHDHNFRKTSILRKSLVQREAGDSNTNCFWWLKRDEIDALNNSLNYSSNSFFPDYIALRKVAIRQWGTRYHNSKEWIFKIKLSFSLFIPPKTSLSWTSILLPGPPVLCHKVEQRAADQVNLQTGVRQHTFAKSHKLIRS